MKGRSAVEDRMLRAVGDYLKAERMEDAEGWHDASRIEPARHQFGGDWRF